MPDLRDYVDIQLGSAREQWRSIASRVPVPGKRQVDFLPVETLICLAVGLVVDRRRYGGGTADNAAEPIPTIARLFCRPNGSILAKMANLDGSLRNGAKPEVQVAAQLLAEPGQLGAVYRLLLTAARSVGIGPEALPDFLGLADDDGDLLLIGQRELDETDVAAAVRPAVDVWRASRTDLDERTTERLLMAAVRVGQHRFASEVLRNHGHRCVFCGLSVSLPEKRAARMLVASHIKPWRACSNAERLDALNGLAACPTHDVAFDTGLLSVNGGLRIHIKPELAAAAQTDPAARAVFGRPPLAERLLLPDGAKPPHAKYLAWHRRHIFDQPQPG